MAGAADNPAQANRHAIGFNLGAMALAVFAVALGAAYALDLAGRAAKAPPAASEEVLTRTLGGRDLHIPRGWLRYDDAQPVDGFVKQIDLRLELPLGAGGRLAPVGVTLTPRSRVRPSASLLDGVYLHEFLPDQLSGPPGLVGKPLRPEDGFEDETVWYDALSPNPFVAKCSSPVDPTQPSQCLRTVYLGPGIAAVYTFGSDVLANWRQFDQALAGPLARIGAL
jgi:hypothetical protein